MLDSESRRLPRENLEQGRQGSEPGMNRHARMRDSIKMKEVEDIQKVEDLWNDPDETKAAVNTFTYKIIEFNKIEN